VTTVALVAATAVALPLARHRVQRAGAVTTMTSPEPGPEPSEAAPVPGRSLGVAAQPRLPLLSAGPVTLRTEGFASWALLNRATGAITGSPDAATATNATESMIKVWIAADYLRLLGGQQPTSARLAELSTMIHDSDNDAAEDVYETDGYDDVVHRMVNVCGLAGTEVVSGWWSMTEMTAADAVRLGRCVADGRAAGPQWTDWVLGEMRQVRGEGRFGIVDALPAEAAATTAIKNGWLVDDDGDWHVNCLAIVDGSVLAVLTRYPGDLGMAYGAGTCRDVAAQLRNG
jgi:hypothetical protein